MTPPARPDPVAALEGQNIWPVTLDRLRKQGYVLVSADSLESALDRAWLASGDTQGMQRPPDLAGHLFAALTRSAQEKGQTDAD